MSPLGNTTAVQTLDRCNWKYQRLFDIYSLYLGWLFIEYKFES